MILGERNFYSGFVSIIGKTNVGKSTLMNKLIGEKISIVSNKPQTTRNKILTVLTDDESQIIFLDTPGLHKPKSKLSKFMLKTVDQSLKEIDLILFLVEPCEKISDINQNIIEKLKKVSTPIILVINKIDVLQNKEQKVSDIKNFYEQYGFTNIISVSGLTGENLDELLNIIKKNLKPGPKYFDDDFLTDMPERNIICEIIREKILFFLKDEIPHGCTVEINSFKKRDKKTR